MLLATPEPKNRNNFFNYIDVVDLGIITDARCKFIYSVYLVTCPPPPPSQAKWHYKNGKGVLAFNLTPHVPFPSRCQGCHETPVKDLILDQSLVLAQCRQN